MLDWYCVRVATRGGINRPVFDVTGWMSVIQVHRLNPLDCENGERSIQGRESQARRGLGVV